MPSPSSLLLTCHSLCLRPHRCYSLALAFAFASEVWTNIDASLQTGTKHLVAHTHNAPVDSTRDAIDHLHVELWEREGGVDAGVAHITLRRGIDHVAHLKTLDS